MIIKKKMSYPAFTGEETRWLYIYLPVGYEYDEETRYPVLYMFDGHNVFYDRDATYGKSWGVGRYLDLTQTPLIVAALECHHGANGERLSEYSPFDFSEPSPGAFSDSATEEVLHFTGHGDETMTFFIRKLKPFMDRRFRTLKDREHTFIAGSSMGGLMALYAVLKYNRIFSKAAALSPSIFLCYPELKTLVRKSQPEDTTIYMDMGTEEMTLEGGSSKAFADFGALLIRRNIALTQRVVPGGEHCEASWEKQLPLVINTLLYN